MPPIASVQAVRAGEGKLAGGRLHVRWTAPAERAIARIGILHGYGDHSGRYGHVMSYLAERGIACHALDFRGHGLSAGRRGFIRQWSEFLADARTFLDSLGGEGPLFLLGHSHGGLVMAMGGIEGLLERYSPRGVVFSAPYLRNRVPVGRGKLALAAVANRVAPWMGIKSGVRGEWLSSDPEMQAEREADRLALRIATPRWFLSMRAAQERAIAEAGRFAWPMLMLVPEADPIADPAAARAFYEGAGSADKMIRSYPGLMHEILRERGREAVFDEILAWISARL